jgi:hypothetical protein
VLCALFLILSQKLSIQTAQSNLHIKIYSKPNFIFFSNLFAIFWIEEKLSFLDEPELSNQVIFSSSEKIAKKNLKNLNLIY